MLLVAEPYHFLLVQATGAKGPIFEDGPNFDTTFRVFHGRDGVVPLSEGSFAHIEKPLPKPAPEFNPLAAKAATISLSGFGGFFSFGDFQNKRNKQNSNKKNPNNLPQVTMASFCPSVYCFLQITIIVPSKKLLYETNFLAPTKRK
jgi:hypothetical protein